MKKLNNELAGCNSGKDFIFKFNPDHCAKEYSGIVDLKSALESGGFKLRQISETYNRITPVLMLEAWLVNLSNFMGFDITTQQSGNTAQFIYEEVNMLNMAELTLLFKRIMKGKYGHFYGKFNGQKIVMACIEFRKERGLILSGLPEETQKQLI